VVVIGSTTYILTYQNQPDVPVHAYNPTTPKQEDYQFKASLDYIERPCLKRKRKKMYGMD
jgi:hypothetical protein